jgi:DNA polymerase III gamma/tau subunit
VELLRFFNAVKELEQTIRNTEHPSIILEYMFLKLSYFSALVSIEEYLKKIRDPKSIAAPAAAPSQARPLESPPAMVGDGDWIPALKARIEKEKPRMASVLSSSSLVVRDNALVIEVGANFENAGKMLKENKPYLHDLARALAGREIGLEIILQPGKPDADEDRIVQDLKTDKKIRSLKDKIKGNVIAVESVKGGKDA